MEFLRGLSGWERMRNGLGGFSNLTELTFVVQHGLHYHNEAVCDVFDDLLRMRFKQELSLLHERGILSISSSVVVKFGPQDLHLFLLVVCFSLRV